MNSTLTQIKTGTSAVATTETGIDVAAKGTFAVVGGAAVIIGLWAAACFIAALVNAGPLGLVKSWFVAVGM
ncbi:MAG: hypothetical protein KKB30_14845 [Proteobacteria bacterium]|nr:hypothetical protein [Pseudomonadota bacterium]MBU1715722.1 hypothetical protein [Pseudomonadota bacterium]